MTLVPNHLARLSGNSPAWGLAVPERRLAKSRGNPCPYFEVCQKNWPRSGCARPLPKVPMIQNSDNRRSPIAGLSVSHFLGHVENKFAVPFFHFAQQAAKLAKKACIFTDAAPGDVVRRLALGKIRQLRRFLTVIKELIEWALESASELFQRFDGRNSMAIFHAGNITTKQPRSLFDVALGAILFFAKCAKAVTNNHACIIPCRKDRKKGQTCRVESETYEAGTSN